MKTIQYTYKDIDKVAKALCEGNVVAFPTDTVFGLAVIYDNEKALDKLKAAKGRPETKPIPTMVSSRSQLETIAHVNQRALALMKAYMPGPITLILKKQENLSTYITNGFDTIAVRMPDDSFILSLIERCGKPLLVSSANISDHPSGMNDAEVLAQLDKRIDGIVLGEAKGNQASTIVDVSSDTYKIVREGPISEIEIMKTLKGEQQ